MAAKIQKLDSVDQLFALLRILAFIGGIGWMFFLPLSAAHQNNLLLNFLFFMIYSIILYIIIFFRPDHIRAVYSVALLLDIVFITMLIRYTGGFNSEFVLAYILFIALHSFYFGLNFGIGVVFLSIISYLIAGDFDINQSNIVLLGFRFAFFFIVGLSMGLISKKEDLDKKYIRELNTQLKQEKDKLSKILRGINVGLVLLNEDREIQWVNKVMENWFGAESKLLGKNCFNVFWKNETFCKQCPTEVCLKTGQIESRELEHVLPDKSTRYFRITAAPLYDENKNIDKVLEVIQDVSEEQELQLNLIQAGKLAAIGELSSGVAHEINNPLGAISICIKEISNALENKVLDHNSVQEINECLKSMREEINRCKRITMGLLSISRKSVRKRDLINLNQIIKNVVVLVKYKAEAENKHLYTEYDEILPMIYGAGEELSQVILNLILNAIDFTEEGKNIYVKTYPENEENVILEVLDQGCGIEENNLAKIFDPFYTTKRDDTGTGLGLTLSMRIIQSHGGRIKVESKLSEGTKIKVYLPVRKE